MVKYVNIRFELYFKYMFYITEYVIMALTINLTFDKSIISKGQSRC